MSCAGAPPVWSRPPPSRACPSSSSGPQGTELPGHAAVRHPAGPARIAGLRLSGDPERLAEWLGGHTLPIAISAGAPMLLGLTIAGPEGLVTL